jgi:hypothetical protein
VEFVVTGFVETGGPPVEGRGGDHVSKKYEGRKDSVMKFIKKLKRTEAHYCISATSVRMYLSSNLSINKMYHMYNEESPVELRIKSGFFHRIFNLKYNLGFGLPRTDVCCRCLELTAKTKNERNSVKKSYLVAAKRMHVLKAKAFFDLVKEQRSDLVSLSFDYQKNLPLPKLSDRTVYYRRQLYLHYFTIVEGSSTEKLSSASVYSYCWTEDQFVKGSNKIACALYNRLMKTNLTNKKTVRLIADGCGGQNKNSTFIVMCCLWLMSAPKHIEVTKWCSPLLVIPSYHLIGSLERK